MTAERPLALDDGAPEPGPARAGLRFGPAVAAALGAAGGAAVFALCHRVLTDDAYITLTYARQLGLHGAWGMVDELPSNTATSPLSVLLLGALTAVTRNAVLAVGVLLVACLAAAGWWLQRIGVRAGAGTVLLPVLGVATLTVNPLLMSAIGLESHLAVTLLIGAVLAAAAGRPGWLGVAAGLLVLTRPDLGPAALLLVLGGARGRGRWGALAAMAGTALPWFAFSWFAFGSAVPDTVILKGPEAWGGWTFWNSLTLYGGIWPQVVALSLLPAAAGVVALAAGWWRNRVAVLCAGAGVAHYATMAALSPAPFFWYSTFWVSALALVGVLATAHLIHRRGRTLAGMAPLAAAVFVLGVTAATSLNDGIPRTVRTPISFNWGSAAQYERLADRLPTGATVQSPGEIGTLAYYCADRCRVVDRFADRGQLAPLLRKRLAAAGPIERLLLEWNYARFDWPARVPVSLRMGTRPVRDDPGADLSVPYSPAGRRITVTPVG